MAKFAGFVGPAYEARSPNAAMQRCINLYPEKTEVAGEKSEYVLYGTPGLATFTTLPTSPIRGMWSGEGTLYVAAGSSFYDVNSAGVAHFRGSIGSGTGPVQIFPNGNQVMIVAGGVPYLDTGTEITTLGVENDVGVVDTSGAAVTWIAGDEFYAGQVGKAILINSITYTISVYIDTKHLTLSASAGTQIHIGFSVVNEVLTASCGAFLDGYFIVARPSTKQINISAINDGKVWGGADYSFKEAYPDNIIGMLADHEELYVCGSQSTEVWQNTGNADFPIERMPGSIIHIGLGAVATLTRFGQGIALLAYDAKGSPIAYRSQGSQPVRISNHALEYLWSTYGSVADAEAFSYREAGHEFWQISFPSAATTFAFDLLTGLWHQRAYGAGLGRHRARCYAYQFSKHLVGDYATGAIYSMSAETTDDAGTAIKRVRRAPHISSELKRMFYASLTIESQYGASLAYTLSWTNDSGNNWGAALPPSGTKISNGYSGRVLAQQWRRLGSSLDRGFELVITGNSKVAIIGAYLEVS